MFSTSSRLAISQESTFQRILGRITDISKRRLEAQLRSLRNYSCIHLSKYDMCAFALIGWDRGCLNQLQLLIMR